MSVVLFVAAKSDYANIGGIFAECMKSIGIEAYAFSRSPTHYEPSSRAVVFKKDIRLVQKVAKRADAIVWMQSLYLDLGVSLKGKRLAVFHGGSLYRMNPDWVNKTFNPKVHVSLVQTAESLGKGAKNEVWMLPAAYIGDVQPDFTMHNKLIVGHFPSGGGYKGTQLIGRVMERYKNRVDYRTSTEGVKWIDNLKRMNECDIYIESLSWASTTSNKHDWSLTALEAAALGDIVVTNFHFGRERYKKEYGDCALQITDTESKLIRVMDRLLTMDKEALLAWKHRSRNWAVSTHGLKATGLRLKGALGI